MYHKKNLNEILQQANILTRSDLSDKTILLRSCLNLTINADGKIDDITRLTESYPTIESLALKCHKLIVIAHMGRPEGYDKSLSLFPIYQIIKSKLDTKAISSEFCIKPENKNINDVKVVFIENIRFFPGEESTEELTRNSFINILLKDVDYFVNDAFPDYRESVSTYYLSTKIKSYLGPSFVKEIRGLSSLSTPKRPYIAIIGGSKLSDKIDILKEFIKTTDGILIAGAMAYTFLKALGVEIGKSLYEEDKLDIAKSIINESKGKILLPIDHMVCNEFNESSSYIAKYTNTSQVPSGMYAIDIGLKTINLYKSVISKAKTILLNGPMGVYEWKNSIKGSYEIYNSIIKNIDAYKVLGGGDSISTLNKLHLAGFNHISTGGGAMLTFLSKERFPTLDIILDQFEL